MEAIDPIQTRTPNKIHLFTKSAKRPTVIATGAPRTKNPKAIAAPSLSFFSLSVMPNSFAIRERFGAKRF